MSPRNEASGSGRTFSASAASTLSSRRKASAASFPTRERKRILRARADAFVVDPAVLGAGPTSDDRHAAEHLMTAASGVVRDVSRMQAAAGAEGTRLLTFTVEAEVAFATPADVLTFTDRLAAAVAALVADVHDPAGQPYRLVAGGHPAPRPPEETP